MGFAETAVGHHRQLEGHKRVVVLGGGDTDGLPPDADRNVVSRCAYRRDEEPSWSACGE